MGLHSIIFKVQKLESHPAGLTSYAIPTPGILLQNLKLWFSFICLSSYSLTVFSVGINVQIAYLQLKCALRLCDFSLICPWTTLGQQNKHPKILILEGIKKDNWGRLFHGLS